MRQMTSSCGVLLLLFLLVFEGDTLSSSMRIHHMSLFCLCTLCLSRKVQTKQERKKKAYLKRFLRRFQASVIDRLNPFRSRL